jgi:hypothetical protein
MTWKATGRRPALVLVGVCAWLTVFADASVGSPRQSATASVDGLVHDSSDAALPDATITLTSLDTGQRRSVRSGSDGAFQFLGVLPGRYQLSVSLDGFASADRVVELSLDERRQLRFRLSIAARSQSVDVVATERPLIEPAKTALGRTITMREIETLPIPSGIFQDFTSLATLAPGVVNDPAGSHVATAGQTGNTNSFFLDGLSVDSAIAGAYIVNLPLEAVREFRVVSNHSSAEFGQASGAIVNVVTRSGTNAPAGRVYYFQQDGAWNATSATAKRVGTTDPGLEQAMVGGYGSGPIVRNKAFIFGSVEQVIQQTVYVNTSPLALVFRPTDPLSWPIETHAPKVFARADVNLRTSNVLTLRVTDQLVTSNDNQREVQSTAERGRSLDNHTRTVAVLDSQVLGSSAVNEIRLQGARSNFETDVNGFCPGCAALNYQGIRLGKPANAPQVFVGERVEAADVLTWLAGRQAHHTLKVGVDLDFVQQSGQNPGNTSGTYTFLQGAPPFDPANRNAYPTRFVQNLGDAAFRVHETILSAFGQDEWQPRHGVAVNLGVRWDHTTWPGPSGLRNDIAPRVGVSVDPWKRGVTVFRAAVGRYFDESQLMIARDGETGFVQLTIQNPGFQGDARHFDPIGPNLRRSGPAVPQYSVNRFSQMDTPYTDQASVGMQRLFGRDVGATIDLVYALGHHLPVGGDLNYPDPTTLTRPDPTVQQIIVTETRGQSWYTGLQVGLRKRLSHRYTYSVAYTWSSSENDTDGPRQFPQDQTNILGDRGPSTNDARHRVSASGVVNLPFDCHLSTMVTATSALPYDLTTGTDDNHNGVPGNDRPAGVGRDSARGSASFDADVRFSKTIGFGRSHLDLLVEVFNLTNHANWTTYSGVVGSAGFGQPSDAGPPRQLQLGARFTF